jgi:hypothetical protein
MTMRRKGGRRKKERLGGAPSSRSHYSIQRLYLRGPASQRPLQQAHTATTADCSGMFVVSIFIALCCAFGLWISSPYLLTDKEIPYDDPQHHDFTPNMLTVKSTAPETLLNLSSSRYHYGRYEAPITQPTLHELNFLQLILQKKEWHFIAVSDGNLLIGMAVANLGYIETAFIYFCDMKSRLHDKVSFVLPGGVGSAHVSSSSVALRSDDCSTFSSSFSSFNLSMCYNASSRSWHLVGGGVLEKKNSLFFDLNLQRSSFGEFSLVYPLGPNRVAYTHKTSSLSAHGMISRTSSSPSSFQSFLGAGLTDFSRTMARSFTEWFWVAFSFQQAAKTCLSETCDSSPSSGNALHGVQLSQGVYRHPPHSPTSTLPTAPIGDLENIIWIHQKPFYLNSPLLFTVTFEGKQIPIFPGQNQLQMEREIVIASEDGRVQLTYLPITQMPTELSTPIFSGSLLHSYGVYSGHIIGEGGERITFEGVPGIFEDHYAKW